MPIDDDTDRFDRFASVLVLLLPLVPATGCERDALRARFLRATCRACTAAALAPLVLPWPHQLGQLGYAHPPRGAVGQASAAPIRMRSGGR